MLIAEELLLIAIDPAKGTVPHKPRRDVLIALAGALVTELALEGRADLTGKRISVIEAVEAVEVVEVVEVVEAVGVAADRSLPTRVQELLARPDSGRRAPKQLLNVEDGIDLWSALVDGLVARGILGRRRDQVLFWQVTRHPGTDLDARLEPVERLRAALRDSAPLEARTAALLALCSACGILKAVLTPADHRPDYRRSVRQAVDATPAAAMVRKAIALTQDAG